MKLSVLIPVFNEEQTLETLVSKVLAAQLPNQMEKEVIIVDDGSTDRTPEILKQWDNHSIVKVFIKPENNGKTSAIIRGIEECSGDYFLIQDADLEYDPEQYPLLLQPILDGEADVVYGSRFLGSIREMKLINRVSNVLSNWTFRLLYWKNITDINTCFKLFPKKYFDSITITTTHFAFETEVTAKLIKMGVRIKEIPIAYVARSKKAGKKIDWPKALAMYWAIIKFRF